MEPANRGNGGYDIFEFGVLEFACWPGVLTFRGGKTAGILSRQFNSPHHSHWYQMNDATNNLTIEHSTSPSYYYFQLENRGSECIQMNDSRPPYCCKCSRHKGGAQPKPPRSQPQRVSDN